MTSDSGRAPHGMTTLDRAFNRAQLVEQLRGCRDKACASALLADAASAGGTWETAEALKEEADRLRFQDKDAALHWCAMIEELGTIAEAPTVIALARMTAALVYYDRSDFQHALRDFDEASELFLRHGHETGWARAQIGRTDRVFRSRPIPGAGSSVPSKRERSSRGTATCCGWRPWMPCWLCSTSALDDPPTPSNLAAEP